jgi:hypothetical protein
MRKIEERKVVAKYTENKCERKGICRRNRGRGTEKGMKKQRVKNDEKPRRRV